MPSQPEGDANLSPAGGQTGGQAPPLVIGAQYIKDLSFENPLGPQGLTALPNAKVQIEVNTSATPLGSNLYEVALTIHGKADACSPYAGGTAGNCIETFLGKLLRRKIAIDPNSIVAKTPVPAFLDKWTTKQKLMKLPAIDRPAESVTCENFVAKESSAVMARFCSVEGMGHTWPGGTYGEPCLSKPDGRACKIWKEVCGGPTDGAAKPFAGINATQLFFEFFKKNPRS